MVRHRVKPLREITPTAEPPAKMVYLVAQIAKSGKAIRLDGPYGRQLVVGGLLTCNHLGQLTPLTVRVGDTVALDPVPRWQGEAIVVDLVAEAIPLKVRTTGGED